MADPSTLHADAPEENDAEYRVELNPSGKATPAPPQSYRKAPRQRLSPCGIARCLATPMMLLVFALVWLSYLPVMYHYGDGTTRNNCILIVFHILIALAMMSYLQTVFTDPGTVPQEWHDQIAALKNPPYKFCKKSSLYRPPRSHFCSITRRVVLNMDHFCPWVVNCVGFFNRKFFILFVSYTSILTFYAAILLYASNEILNSSGAKLDLNNRNLAALGHTRGDSMVDSPRGRAAITLNVMAVTGCLLDAVLSITLFFFAGAHIYMACNNMTTIESGSVANMYKLTTRRNLESVFGSNTWYWPIPLYGDGPAGNGVQWQLYDGTWDGLPEESNPSLPQASSDRDSTQGDHTVLELPSLITSVSGSKKD